MHALYIHEGLHVRKSAIATTLAVAMLLFGCAVEPTPGFGRSSPGCGMNAVLYCDLSPHGERCQCVRHTDLRDLARTFSRR